MSAPAAPAGGWRLGDLRAVLAHLREDGQVRIAVHHPDGTAASAVLHSASM